jgi:hypothetical protein
MTPGQRCDEIITMIDEVLDASVRTEQCPGSALFQGPDLDLSWASTGLEVRS